MLLCSRARVSGHSLFQIAQKIVCAFWNSTPVWHVPFTHNWTQEPEQGFPNFLSEMYTCRPCWSPRMPWGTIVCLEIFQVRMATPPTTFGVGVVPLDIWEQRLFLTLGPLLFKSHGKWIIRSGFNSQSQEGGIYPFCFIFYGFWLNSMLWVALTAWSWLSCSYINIHSLVSSQCLLNWYICFLVCFINSSGLWVLQSSIHPLSTYSAGIWVPAMCQVL